MGRRLLITLASLTALFGAVLGLSAVPASAARTPARQPARPPAQALEIAPPLLGLKADPGKTINTKIQLHSISNGKLVVTSQVNDFVAAGEDGVPKLLMDEDKETSPYSLKQWVTPFPRMTLNPKESKALPLTIKVPKNAAPGGYYGVVRFTATPPELEGTGVSLSASLGALVLLKVNGDAKEGLAVEEFATRSGNKNSTLLEGTPVDFLLRLKNTGNVHEQPAIQISVKDMFGKKVADVFMNQPPRNILPSSIRKFEEKLDKSELGKKILFGRYTAELKVTYGEHQQTVTKKITFWVIPYKLIIAIIVVLIAGFFLFRHLLRRYNRRIIKKAQGGGSKK